MFRSGTKKDEKSTFWGKRFFSTHSLQIARKSCSQCSHYKCSKIRGHSRPPIESQTMSKFYCMIFQYNFIVVLMSTLQVKLGVSESLRSHYILGPCQNLRKNKCSDSLTTSKIWRSE